MTKIGLDNLEEILKTGKDQKVGLITNHTGLNSDFINNIMIFKKLFPTNFMKIFTPEHGLFGDEQAGIDIKSYYDKNLEIEIVSLYGNEIKSANIDNSMRENDISYLRKNMPVEQLNNIDILFFDVQDVGTRIYTYIATMILSMEQCNKLGKKFVILDRPNPIGRVMEGPILDINFRSFIGITEVPIRHGMTAGEIGEFYNKFYLKSSLQLKIIKIDNWNGDYYNYMPWIMPSPNMPTLNSASVYPGQVMFEGLNISEGRGTTKPFEIIGAPWLDSYKLATEMNALDLKGVKFAEVKFIPQFSKYQNERCNGVEIYITDISGYEPYFTSLKLISMILENSYNHVIFYDEYFDRVNGTDKIRNALIKNNINELIPDIRQSVEDFKDKTEEILLY
jgi:uncharacterized protein YbbC (DUF1343 family)